MNRDKQIEEMAKNVCHLDRTCNECMTSFECKAMMYAKRFYTAGYRKSTEVAREIFEEIEKVVNYALCVDITDWSAYNELKKKYTEEIKGGEADD